MADSEKRHLPLLQPGGDGPDRERPRWHWAGIGGLVVVVTWLPLAMLAQLARARVVADLKAESAQAAAELIKALSSTQRMWLGFVMVILPLLTVVGAGLVGGIVVGRYGEGAGKREATLGGLLAAAFGLLLTISGAGGGAGGLQAWTLPALLIGLLVAVSAYGGAVLGQRLRP